METVWVGSLKPSGALRLVDLTAVGLRRLGSARSDVISRLEADQSWRQPNGRLPQTVGHFREMIARSQWLAKPAARPMAMDCLTSVRKYVTASTPAASPSLARVHGYRESHPGIPKGLKLVGRETCIREFEVVCE